jgi:hypothetical protein
MPVSSIARAIRLNGFAWILNRFPCHFAAIIASQKFAWEIPKKASAGGE